MPVHTQAVFSCSYTFQRYFYSVVMFICPTYSHTAKEFHTVYLYNRSDNEHLELWTHILPSVVCGSGVGAGSKLNLTSGGVCFCMGAGGAGGGVYLKALRLTMMWFPTNVLRPKARQSTTVILRGGWRSSFSGNSCRTTEQNRVLTLHESTWSHVIIEDLIPKT